MSLVFNKDLRMDYSWLPKGITSAIINQIHSGSKGLIAAFWSDGEFICACLNQTVNSEWFKAFLWILKFFLKMRKIDYENNAIIMLDNAPYHSSKETKDAINKLLLNVYFLPPYSPILAPVEQFFKLIKSKVRSAENFKNTNFKSKNGTKYIKCIWNKINPKWTRFIWSKFIKTALALIYNS